MSQPTSTALAPLETATELAVLEALDEGIHEYAQASLAEGTARIYEAHWKTFLKWCKALKFEPLPTLPAVMARYATALAKAGKKWSTINVAMSVLNQANAAHNGTSVRSDPYVRTVLKGIRRTLGIAPDQAAPFLAEHLKKGVQAFSNTTAIGIRDRAMLVTGFFGAFRRSELVGLNLGDLTLDSRGWVVHLRRSKTDQEGRGRKLGLPYAAEPSVCPVRTVQAWMDLRKRAGVPEDPESPLFLRVDNLHGDILDARLTGQVVNRIVKQAAEAAGLSITDFSAHSLRAGFVTTAAKAGKSVHAIKRQTGHNSISMIDRYVRDATIFEDNAATGLGV